MEKHTDLAHGIVGSIAEVWEDDKFHDFTVTVEDEDFRCHRFILNAVSHYFRGLFRSGMKETSEHCVTSQGCSKGTFKLILKVIYTGCNVLTEENMLDLWFAVDQLQIPFLQTECENFVLKHINEKNMLDVWHATYKLQVSSVITKCDSFIQEHICLGNYENVYKSSKSLGSEEGIQTVYKFMLKNFDYIRKSSFLVELSPEELIMMVESQDLVVASEDGVIDAILTWVNYDPGFEKDSGETDPFQSDGEPNRDQKINQDKDSNDQDGDTSELAEEPLPDSKEFAKLSPSILDKDSREKHFGKLVKASRISLVSPACLETLFRNPLVQANEEMKEDVLAAMMYKMDINRRHGQWPKSAVHRICSDYRNVAINISDDTFFEITDAFENENYENSHGIPGVALQKIQICVYDNSIYLLGFSAKASKYKLFKLKDTGWKHQYDISDFKEQEYTLLSMGTFIYVFGSTSKQIYNINPRSKTVNIKSLGCIDDVDKIMTATTFGNQIIIFSQKKDIIDKTVVHSLDVDSGSVSILNPFEGHSNNLICYSDYENTYILQSNGMLWNITKVDNRTLEYTFLTTLWDEEWFLYGAVPYRSTLVILGDEGTCPKNRQQAFPPLYSHIQFWWDQAHCTGFLPVIMPKKWFQVG